MSPMLVYWWLLPVGFLVGLIGTLVGAGGGFILVPLLLLAYPREQPEIVTSISLAVVFFNALSGSVAYGRMGRIDYKSSLLFALATIPGAIVGAFSTSRIPRHWFDLIMGVVLTAVAILILRRPHGGATTQPHPEGSIHRVLVERDGTTHRYSFRPGVGIALSAAVGYLSSLLGIGGGIIHVPALVHFMNFPVHIATATSHLVLAIMALAGTLVHILTGSFHRGYRRTIMLGIGVLIGAQVGAALSSRLHGVWIIRGLAIALGLVGIRLMLVAWAGA